MRTLTASLAVLMLLAVGLAAGAAQAQNPDAAKAMCADLGFTPGAEKFGECVVKLMEAGMAGAAQAQNLPRCTGAYSTQWHNCVGTHEDADGDVWVGGFRHGKWHGQGILTWSNGDKYVGEFRDGTRTGQGTYTFPNGNKYVGEWRDNKRTGLGTYTYPDGEKYVGQFRDDERHGQGTYTWPDGRKYVGEWSDNKRTGLGTYTYADGDIYVGEWRDNKRHGLGTLSTSWGMVLKAGQWANNVLIRDDSVGAAPDRDRERADARRIRQLEQQARDRRAADAKERRDWLTCYAMNGNWQYGQCQRRDGRGRLF